MLRQCQGLGAHTFETRAVNPPCPICGAPCKPSQSLYPDPTTGQRGDLGRVVSAGGSLIGGTSS